MSNELILCLALPATFGGVLAVQLIFKEQGLYLWTIVATIAANIEVLILVRAFGMEMTLGNILFASTFLVTDVLSELYGKKAANRAVGLGIATSVIFLLISRSWLLYQPSENDFIMPAIRAVFSNTARMLVVGIAVYVIVQLFDVWMYHKLWDYTTKKSGSSKPFLWLRNNAATMLSQLINTVLFTLGAFAGSYGVSTLISIAVTSYVIFIVTSLVDTPFLYLARYLANRHQTAE